MAEYNPSIHEADTPEEEQELSHSDKLVGVFSEPSATFEHTSKFQPRTKDWIIPLLLFIAAAVITNVVMMSDAQIRFQVQQKQQERIQQMVEEGQITQEMADAQIERMQQMSGGGIGIIISAVSTVIMVFIMFFIIAGVFHLCAKWFFKGEGSFSASMVAYGLPYYIAVIQMIVMIILALVLNKLLTGVNVAAFVDTEPGSFTRLILSKLDPFSIWFYGVIAIGFAKMHRSASVGKYMILIYGLWIGFSILIFLLAQVFPFFMNFAM